MRIECPGCEAAYEVPDAQIRPGRSVRCVRCDRQWQPAGELPETLPQPQSRQPGPVEQEPVPLEAGPLEGGSVEAGANPVRLRRSAAPPVPLVPAAGPGAGSGGTGLAARIAEAWRRPGWGAGWAASLIVMAGLLASAAYWHTAIMQDWPPSIRLYTALGVPPPQT